jgi:uncharacterized protein YndB with AHSA1/START domain
MSSWRKQALIEAPVEEVWRFVGDPESYPAWAKDVVEVTGLPRLEPDATFRQRMKTPLGKTESTFRIEELEELREIKMRCTSSGLFSHWILTEAQENTFLDVEIGMEPTSTRYRIMSTAVGGKRWFHRLVDESIDGIRRALAERRGTDETAPTRE